MTTEEILCKCFSGFEVPVYFEVPPKPPERYVVIEKSGGGEVNHLYFETVIIQSYADSLIGASELNESVKRWMKELIKLNSFSSIKLNSDYNFTDTTKKKYRYQAVFDLVLF